MLTRAGKSKANFINFFVSSCFALTTVSYSGEAKAVASNYTPVKLSTNCSLPQDLPLVTHWSNSLGVHSGASEQITVNNPQLPQLMQQPDSIKYIYNFNFLPTVSNYGVTNFSLKAVSNAEASAWIQNLCKKTGQAFQFRKPPIFDGDKAIDVILSKGPRKSGVVLIVTGLTVSKSMFAVYLPANWDPQKSYPVIFNGFYDLNENIIQNEGAPMGALIARSVQKGGSGAIGLLWNGAGAFASRTVNKEAFAEFQKVINLVSRLGGDRKRIISFGGSRGGMTALQMASNPYPHNYVFRYVDAGVPAAHLGSVAQVTSPTIPSLLTAVDWSVGLADSHKNSFIYPHVGNGLQGLNGMQAHLKILTGASDPGVVDAKFSIGSPAFVQAIKKAGTQVFLELSSHDDLVPSFDQLWLYHQYVRSGIPVELKYNYLAGHAEDRNIKFSRIEKQMKMYTHSQGTQPVVQKGKVHFYKVDTVTGNLIPAKNTNFLFTLEVPRYVSPEVNGVLIATGRPQTQVELSIQFPTGGVSTFYQTLNENGFGMLKFDPREIPVGIYKFVKVRIKTPSDKNWRAIPLNKRPYKMSSPGEPLVVENLNYHPAGYTGAVTTAAIKDAYLGTGRQRAYGIFNGVSYGLVEPGL